MESSSGLQDLIDRAAFLSTEHQQELLDGPGQAAWDVDLPSQSFVFHSDPPTTLSCDFLGSASPKAGSWLWGWENVNGFPDGVIALAGTIRDYGEANGIPELTSAQIPLDDDTAIDIAHRLTLAAKSVSGKYAHYSGPTGGRTRVWLLLEGPAVALADPIGHPNPPGDHRNPRSRCAVRQSQSLAVVRAATRSRYPLGDR
ncbi:DUF6882 domain-containing protein [Mycobacteroides franklinii]|uniref:DUF6882 domain-containing protein n=1 Tax=Mycobacteroides franklinii TaxID=948102 RepID=UPI001066A422|nr:DUF6882 domain-containing protein [Mycobacteroides franklinii]